MDRIANFLEYILEVEGKTSKDSDDSASKCYPGGIHTNKGITFCKWEKVAEELGYNTSHEAFLNMTNEQYKEIIYHDYFNSPKFNGFWKIFETKPIQSLFLIDWAFNRGNGGMENDLSKWQREKLGIKDSNITIPEIFANIRNSNMSDHMMLLSLFYRRIKVYERIVERNPSKEKYLPGWRRRFKKFYLRFAPQDVIQTLRSQGVDFSGL